MLQESWSRDHEGGIVEGESWRREHTLRVIFFATCNREFVLIKLMCGALAHFRRTLLCKSAAEDL